MVNLVAVQMTSTPSVEDNLNHVEQALANEQVPKNALPVLVPKMASYSMPPKSKMKG